MGGSGGVRVFVCMCVCGRDGWGALPTGEFQFGTNGLFVLFQMTKKHL